MAPAQPIWEPMLPADTIPMNVYRNHVNRKFGQNLCSSQELHRWSVTHPHEFWIDLHEYTGVVPPLPSSMTRAYDPVLLMSAVPKFFEGATVNYAENVFHGKALDRVALIGIREGEDLSGDIWTWARLRETVRALRSALLRSGISHGDRVGAIISTSVWSVALLLATVSIGAVWTSIAPDIGEEGCVSRLDQISPKMLFADSSSTFKGKARSHLTKIENIVRRLSQKPQVFLIPISGDTPTTFPTLDLFFARSKPEDALEFSRVPYSHPLYILYTSGTTGQPKCLVHSHSVIIQHKKTSLLHNSLTPDDVVFQYSSTSWVLWNIMVGHLAVGTALILYDGSPLWPNPAAMVKIIEHHRVTYWGTSPRYLQELEMSGVIPKEDADLSSLKMVQTGGSHLAASQYLWFYRVFPRNVHLTSVTGGTDLVTSWVGTDPAGPLYPGEIQLPMLGQDVDIADPATGKSIKETGRHGEFVCRSPFPSMPVFFWGDEGMTRYKETYFDLFPDCWAQHDWASYNPVTKGWQIHGRSDGVLNPQGIRFGSSDIYSIVEAAPFNDVISTTLCVGRRRPRDTDEVVFLFVVMQGPDRLSDGLVHEMKDAIRRGLSHRHVPRFVVQVPEIPMTVNGKKVETLVKRILCTGELPETVSNTVANPGCLQDFQRFYGLEQRQSRL
ncbi:uncharacterized protein BJX67DRAFT_224374 [Aspergillus lucknowensis]|uniref:AMP-dependent synthetase/ligase domain-containing protein n=1 Tax=Aspergillus lucknowensis TaxID=176173 RepID=A0ABR4LJ49_9EURO